MQASSELMNFAREKGIEGLTEPTLGRIRDGAYPVDRAGRFLAFQDRINRELLRHPVITSNAFTAWFSGGEFSDVQLKHFIQQFSVFSNQFLVAQLHKMINADSLEEMHASKEILANEIGVVFTGSSAHADASAAAAEERDMMRTFGGTDGSVEGGVFHFKAAHFELLMRMAHYLGLEFRDLGKRRHGSQSTLFFCDELIRLYGNEDYAVSTAASYAVENWAAAGFWKELIQGLVGYKARRNMERLPLAFFTWHDQLEANHARHTQEELEEYYFTHEVNEDAFIRFGNEMLDGVNAFWRGLDADRRKVH